MFSSHRYLLLAALVMGLAAAQVHAQPRRGVYRGLPPGYPSTPFLRNTAGVFANPQIAPGLSLQQAAYNTAVMGNAYAQVPPYALGYDPYQAGPVLATGGLGVNPYALSAGAGYSPYAGGASLGTSPYSLSTGGSSSYTPYYGGYGGYGQDPFGAQLQGYASLTSASGKFYGDIQKAALTREQVRQAHLDTIRRRIELERWIEDTRIKPHQLREREMALELNNARGEAPEANVSSGRALNTLLGSIQKSAVPLSKGPNVPIDPETLKHINISGAGAAGNVGMLKDPTKMSWPRALLESSYDETRKRLNQNLVSAVLSLKEGDPVPENKLKDIRADFKTINDRISDSADDLTPNDYIDARRFLNQLSQAVRALGDKNVVNYFSNKNWTPQGANVAELVSQLSKEGLNFAPATPGDAPAYKALYLAMRQYEAGLASAQAMK